MFKKAFKVSSNNSLSGKDKKKLNSDLVKYFNADIVNIILEKNNPVITLNKVQGSKFQIYMIGDIPMFVDVTGKGDLFPTIYAFQQYPTLAKAIEINPGVEVFLQGGAQLMWPGVKDPKSIGDFKKDDVAYVRSAEGRVIAVGALACGSEEVAPKDPSGTAMHVLHLIDDKLWALGPKKDLAPLLAEAPKATSGKKDEGKEEKKVDEVKKDKSEKEKEKKKEESSEEEEEEEEEEEDDGASDLAQYFGGMIQKKPAGGAGKKPSAPAKNVPKKAVTTQQKNIDFDDDEDDRKKKGGKKGKGSKGGKKDDDEDFEEVKKEVKPKGKKEKEKEKEKEKGKAKGKKKAKDSDEEEDEDEEEEENEESEEEEKEESKEGKSNIPTKFMDEYLMEAFLTALKISLDDHDLPMDGGDFYSNHLLPCKKEGVFIDLKNTSYKKMGKFLQSMNKLGIIEFKESKKGAAPQIVKVNRQHPKLADFEPVVTKAAKKEKDEEVSDDDRWPKVDIQEMYKIKPQIASFFPETEDKDKLYHIEEVQNVFQKYINAHKLVEKKFIKLDDVLKPLFWVEKPQEEEEDNGDEGEEGEGKKKKKKTKEVQYTTTKEELNQKLFDYLTACHKITDLQTKESEVKQGAFKGINVVSEKAHNKNVTRIVGLEPFKFNISSLVNKFQLRFACSVSTHNIKEKNVEKTEITVHGNFLDEIIDYLTDECKIDKKYITSTNKIEKKKKERTFNV